MPIGPDDLTPPLGLKMPRPPHVMLIVAHSNASKGVVVGEAGDSQAIEYEVSKRATVCMLRALSNDFRVSYSHQAIGGDRNYLPMKVEEANAIDPDIVVEVHCNAGPPSANYREVIYYPGSARGKRAAELVAEALTTHFMDERPCKARENSVAADKHIMYLLDKAKAPAIIVEGFFLTNQKHRELLLKEGGAEDYGSAVAAGLRKYLEELRVA